MNRTHLLGLGFLAPAIAVVVLFFLLPVLLTVMFSFTNMSTATGILGGAYQLTVSNLRRLPAEGVDDATIARLETAGFAVTDDTLAAFAAEFGDDRADAMRQNHMGEDFTARRDLERVLRDLPGTPIRAVRERKAAADLFSVSIIGTRYPTEADFREAMDSMGIAPEQRDTLTRVAYTGWTFTTENFELLYELPSTLRYALNTAIYVSCTLVFNIGFGLFLALSTFYLPGTLANTFRAIWFLPRILPPVLYVLMWNWFTWDNGFLSNVLAPLGIAPRNWMLDSTFNAWVVVILINGFVGASMGMILFASAIRAIPESMLHAAAVDGANRWQQVRHIIVPQLRWPILFVTSYQTLSLLTSFEYILLATDGGPGRGTEVWSLAAYHTALNNYGGNLEYGLGAAYALVLVIIGIALSLTYMRFFNFRDLVARPRIEQ